MGELEKKSWAGQAKIEQIFLREIVQLIHNSMKNICYKLLIKNLGKNEDYLGRGIGEEKGIDSVTTSTPAAVPPLLDQFPWFSRFMSRFLNLARCLHGHGLCGERTDSR